MERKAANKPHNSPMTKFIIFYYPMDINAFGIPRKNRGKAIKKPSHHILYVLHFAAIYV